MTVAAFAPRVAECRWRDRLAADGCEWRGEEAASKAQIVPDAVSADGVGGVSAMAARRTVGDIGSGDEFGGAVLRMTALAAVDEKKEHVACRTPGQSPLGLDKTPRNGRLEGAERYLTTGIVLGEIRAVFY